MDTTTHYILSILTADRISGALRLKFMFGGLPSSDVQKLLSEMVPGLHADNLALAESLIKKNMRHWDSKATEEFERQLAVRQGRESKKVGVGIVHSRYK